MGDLERPFTFYLQSQNFDVN